MAENDWRSEAFRRKVITQIDEAVRNSNTPMTKSSVEMENHVYNKAKSREEYLALVARLIIHVKDFNSQRREKQQAAMQQAVMGGAVPTQMGAAGNMGQPGGMQDPINALQNMAMSGAGMSQGQPGMINVNPQQMPLAQQQQRQQQVMQQFQQQRMQAAQQQQQQQQMPRPPLQRQDAFIVTSSQTVPPGQPPLQSAPQSTPMSFGGSNVGLVRQGQYTSGLSTQQASPQMMMANQQGQGPVPSPVQQSSQQPAGSPMSMMTSPPQIVPSPGQRGSMSVGAPSPSTALNTPGNPGSVGASPSPASQAEEQAYLDKLKQLSIYIEPLRRMIKKTEEGKDSENRRNEINKLKNLHDILINPNKRVPMATLLKCEQGLEKMQFSNKLSSSMTPQVHMCQPLLDAVALHMTSPTFNHTLQRTFGPSVAAIYGNPIRVPSPPAKRKKVEKQSRLPDILQGEIMRLDHRFRIKLDPIQHAESKDVNLLCKLEDHNLPSVPPIVVMIPHAYPHCSPELVTNSKREYDSTQFLKSIQTALETHLLELPSKFSFTSLLDMWEMSVRRACLTTT